MSLRPARELQHYVDRLATSPVQLKKPIEHHGENYVRVIEGDSNNRELSGDLSAALFILLSPILVMAHPLSL